VTVVATDTFNRADGGLGANWSTITDIGSAPTIVTNTAGAPTTSVDYDAKYTAASTGAADHYCQADIIVNTATTTEEFGVFVRMTSVGINADGYVLLSPSFSNSTGGTHTIYRCNGAGFTQIANVGSPPVATGTRTIKLVAQGSTLTGYDNGVSKLSVSDATYGGTQQYTGIHAYWDTTGTNNNVRIDNFEIGDLVGGASGPVAKQMVRDRAKFRASVR